MRILAGLPTYPSDDYGAYPTSCSEGRDLDRIYQASTKDWLPVHHDDASTCDHALDASTLSTSDTRALLLLL